MYNTNLLHEGRMNELIPVSRRGNVKVKCIHCLGVYGRRKISVHVKNCSKRPGKSPVKSPKKRKNQALREHSLPLVGKGASENLIHYVLQTMKQDAIAKEVVSDDLIMKMGSQFLLGMNHHTDRETTVGH